MSLYENIKDIAKTKGYSINRLEKELGFARSYIVKFKTITPSMDKVQKIADFLGVTTDYLMTGKSKDAFLTAKDERDIAKSLSDTLNKLESQDSLMFDGEAIDEETRELLKISLENAIRTAKITAKKKFTPNKYHTDE